MEKQNQQSSVFSWGIAPDLLTEQVRNTAPFGFDLSRKDLISEPYFKSFHDYLCEKTKDPQYSPDYLTYFNLCISAHHATVATFVPTDIDIHIRFKLWNSSIDNETILKMADIVRRSRTWNHKKVTARFAVSPVTNEFVSGHHGEWFSTAVAAYAACLYRGLTDAQDWVDQIFLEIDRELQIFEDLKKARDGIGMLKASMMICHNLGDLKRVFAHWNLDDSNELLAEIHKRVKKFELAETLNREVMAAENHRHYPLRPARALRRSDSFLLPLGPFFDDWGSRIAGELGRQIEPREMGEIIEALVDGHERLKTSVGYMRAMAGIEDAISGGRNKIKDLVPAKIYRKIETGELRKLISIPKNRFNEQWSAKAFKFK